jgi:phosphohistidine phosphatase SixA
MLKLHSTSPWLKLLLPIALLACFTQNAICQEPLVVFLVRHAEKVDDSKNSKLSQSGIQRAAVLAHTLRSAKIKNVQSTDYPRTRLTAKPFLAEHHLEIQQYEARYLSEFADKLKSAGGRHLVIGHSNTTPKLVKLLGGDPGSAITDKEYDRLYIVSIDKDGNSSTLLLRFGAPFVPPAKQKELDK